jgi:hypothetical protein
MPVPDFSPGEVLTAAAMDSVGMWRVGGGTITGTSVQINDCFTSSYQNYKIIIRPTTLGADLRMRLRNAGGDSMGSDYFWTSVRIDQIGAANNNTGNAQAYFLSIIANASLADFCGVDLTVFGPQLNIRTVASGGSTWNNGSGFTGGALNYLHNTSFQATGFTLFTSNGSSFSAVVDVYGLRGA